jgi:hypothetical protein
MSINRPLLHNAEFKECNLNWQIKKLKYSKKFYSYVLVIEDEQQPELVGKIMIMQYGKQLKTKNLIWKKWWN